ncbi:PREDICTED: phosphoinositide phosphatase SAC3 isoform X1 [Theobroma cacao]|uniref:Phosphoinositide phosphatase SAC3 isoform X1 n=1 Tax=Theobroma cacao TaxID=3641 RepID=A0AB32WYB4_THECC|nr:PREDICTED: phosphoinositide phosphatase SAC3 isoform X1 [Theobroma cacao]
MESSAAENCNDVNNNESSSQSQTSTCMQKFRLYETRSNFYMIGRDKSRTYWRVLKIDRLDPTELNIREDSTSYTEGECFELLRRIHEGNKSTGGLKFVTVCYGIVGFIKFLGPYYMLLITKRRQIGAICGHNVYAVSKCEMIPLPNSTVNSSLADSKNENRYKKLLCTVDLTQNFFFSYSYHVMCSLQENLYNSEPDQVAYETMFVWNEFLTRGIRNHLQNTLWTVALVYGFFQQATLSVSGRDFKLTLIARRSRHYAGTRYLKRGVDEKGRVANDVETEQIVFEDVPDGLPTQITSIVQNRGSIPLFWSQETSRLNIKPDIILSKKDQNYEATRLHFENLVERYGKPIIILNLIKTQEKKPRESILRQEFANAIDFINKDLSKENQLRFLHWDLHKHSRGKATNVLLFLGKMAAYVLTLTDFFYCRVTSALRPEECMAWPYSENIGDGDMSPTKYCNNVNEDANRLEGNYSGDNNVANGNHSVKPPTIQRGVLRTNCIDCLDRTNVAQYAYGLAALGHQLHALGIKDTTEIDLDDPLADELMDLYERMGDTLAHQYGGSAAHHKIFSERRGHWRAATQSQEFFRTLQRYYSNAYMDAEKQDAINVFLGHFQPQPGKPALWELGSDQHYRGRNGLTIVDEDGRSLFKRSFSDGNILRQTGSPMSATNDKQEKFTNSTLPDRSQGGSNGLSDSSPEISTCESDISYSRCTPSMPRRQLFGDMQRDHCLETDHIFFYEHGDAFNCSNFVDLDWLSSSGNSCEDEPFESSAITANKVVQTQKGCCSFTTCSVRLYMEVICRSSVLTSSPVAGLSSENVVNGILGETTPSSSEYGSSMKGRQQTGTELSFANSQNSNVLEEFSDSFVQWVNHGEMLCH